MCSSKDVTYYEEIQLKHYVYEIHQQEFKMERVAHFS